MESLMHATQHAIETTEAIDNRSIDILNAFSGLSSYHQQQQSGFHSEGYFGRTLFWEAEDTCIRDEFTNPNVGKGEHHTQVSSNR